VLLSGSPAAAGTGNREEIPHARGERAATAKIGQRFSLPSMRYDLHSHSTWSDGVLPPAELVRRAAARGVEVFALTDHDEVGGLREARAAAGEAGIGFVDGVEVSVSYREETLHVLGFQMDADRPDFVAALAGIRHGRDARARRISDSLAAAGIDDTYDDARALAGNEELISRAHFARVLVGRGVVRNTHDCFKSYLVPGKPGYVPHAWPAIGEAIGWIRAAGGTAVLAHPGRYRFDADGMRELLAEFRDAGGTGVEVVTPAHSAAQFEEYATLARVFGLKGSVGSDFHSPDECVMDLGAMPELPEGVVPIWSDW
jgi:predicted metal-dependent phosphoesterase TrpH